jgi:hypothetical protein
MRVARIAQTCSAWRRSGWAGSKKGLGEVQIVVHLDQQFRQLDLPHLTRQPRFQALQSLACCFVELLARVDR